MTQEEKTKAYDEAIKRAEAVIKVTQNKKEVYGCITTIFPELAESEDERIRKAILNYLTKMWGNSQDDVCGVHVEDVIDWLEKQGEQKSQKALTWKHWKNGIAGNSEGKDTFLIKWSPWHYSVSSCLGSECDYIELSELDELLRKPNFRERYDRIKDSEWFKKTHEGMSVSEENIEPKPKFKVGEWVTNGDYTWKIVEVKPLDYILQSQDGNIVDDTISYVDEQFHSFTIQDAKDGDVLAGKIDGDNYILIFKQVKDGWIETYGHYYDSVDRFCVPSQLFCRDYQGSFTPATKEQRDILFKKMHEAGYIWDAEKKESKLLVTNGGDFESTPTDEEVQKLHDHLEMHKELGDIPKVVTFTNSDNERIIEKLNEVIGKLGDIYEVLSKPFQFPYMDYTPPQEPWYKTHGVEKVTPVTCETTNEVKAEDGKDNDKERTN